MTRLELRDIQGNVVSAYRTTHARYLFFSFERKRSGLRDWLRWLAPTFASATVRCPEVTVNVAFSARGLANVGLPAEALQLLPVGFRAGMQARSSILGDLGASAPRSWENWCHHDNVDALVTISGWSDASCLHKEQTLCTHAHTPLLIHSQPATSLTRDRTGLRPAVDRLDDAAVGPPFEHERYEPFGFRDGMSNPVLEGSDRRIRAGHGTLRRVDGALTWQYVKAGEFILGCEDETRQRDLPAPLARYFRNGSYVVWRKLRQDVDGFRRTFGPSDGSIAAAVVGRTHDGHSLARQAPGARQNDFTYGDGSTMRATAATRAVTGETQANATASGEMTADGMRSSRHNPHPPGCPASGEMTTDGCPASGSMTADGCPASAHIRRANPRDGLDFADTVVGRHRLIRRGMPYRQDGEQGLIFVCFNADIERQFEFVQQRWINHDPSRPLERSPDPIATPNQGGDVSTFVTTRAGEYFFQPGRLGLHAITDRAGEG